jgi:hypothetical protein
MHVNIGPYLNWWGPYQIADLLMKVGVSGTRCHKIGRWLANTWVNDVCEFVHKRRHRRIEVQIDDYDTWSLDHTLALIILPALKKMKNDKMGISFTDLEDAPQFPDDECTDPDCDFNHASGYSEKRWEYILDEMIFAFEKIADDDWDMELYENGGWTEENMAKRREIQERISNGTRLFGKYYQSLWT